MTSVFRKKTHTERYLNFRSYHHPCIKTGTISYLKNRAHNICSEEALETEVKHLTTAFQSNRYPSWVIHRALIKEKKSRKEHKVGENSKTLYIPKSFSKKVQKCLEHLNIRTIHRTQTTIRNRLVRVKGKENLNDKSGIIGASPTFIMRTSSACGIVVCMYVCIYLSIYYLLRLCRTLVPEIRVRPKMIRVF